ncbi:MAG: hypothetical protein JSU75_11665, partial [Gammaproteobacteria bacterium]
MHGTALFAYVQTRLQARHGTRPDELVWRRLQGTGDFANYLQLAQHTTLRPWVVSLHPSQDSHEIELTLRRLFRQHVDEVARWVPAAWRPAVEWVRRVPDLPALGHLLAGEAVPAWMRNDPALRTFTSEHISIRLDAMRQSDCTALVWAFLAGTTLADAWRDCWHELWPKAPRPGRGLEELDRLYFHYLQALLGSASGTLQVHNDWLQQRLVSAFRRYTFQPATAFVHLALTA